MHPRYTKRLQELCSEIGFPYEPIVGTSRKRITVYVRRFLISKISEEFPALSTTRLGELFNRDHSSIVPARRIAARERTEDIPLWLPTKLSTRISDLRSK